MLDKLKQEVVEIGHLLLKYGLVCFSAGNISARDLESGNIVISPSGIPYERLRPKDVVVVDIDGKIIEGNNRPSSEMLLHLLAYQAHPQVGGVVHTHSPYASSFAVLDRDIPAIVAEMAFSIKAPAIKVAPYASPGSRKVAELTVETMGHASAVLMANHGAVTTGLTLGAAFGVACTVEEIAKIYYLSLTAGKPKVLPDQEIKSILDR